jgi:putative DNA primase/helicase
MDKFQEQSIARGAVWLDEHRAPVALAAGAPAGEPEALAHESDDEHIARLAGLSAAEYERVRSSEAKCLGFRATALDKIVASERRRAESDGGIGFDNVDPWPHPVAGDQLLSDVASVINRFIICKPETAHAAALWATMTWLIDVVETAPLAMITAPEMRCGKSQLLTVLGKLSRRPVVASNISPAALFRVIDAWQPTLVIDEADAFMRENEELRGILNSGHKRDSAYVIRCEGEDFAPQKFSTWGAKAVAGIGHLAGTLMDRAVILDIRRKMPHENVERLRNAEPDLFPTMAAKLCRWAEDNREAVRRARPDLPAQLNDRMQDNWEPLLAIADVAGGVWRELAPRVAIAISGQGSEDGLTVGAELLSDIREIFETKRVERIGTSELIEALCSDDERPWATYNHGKPISPRQMARRLKGYDITSKTMRIGYGNCKGYEFSQFLDAFSRYLSSPPSASVTASQASNQAGLSVTDRETVTVTPNLSVTLEASRSKGCDAVTDRKGGTENNDLGVTEI